MIQWSFLYYLANVTGSPCNCMAEGSCCYTDPVLDAASEEPLVASNPQGCNTMPVVHTYLPAQTQPTAIVYQQPPQGTTYQSQNFNGYSVHTVPQQLPVVPQEWF
ncbi:Oidioi.mRNA.OKI2018_I69.PAR.g12886.t1.cds [Oikopleura dioica]|uniref:Oidioi.mRNA.OKI2018_I69.PAR.g12886.t1.cds n=1 Tax=Oikopleura dioica TaxID=34765 RepID=A0ABN7S900_OIKDI|nr:Oidioi.mRNA.OKI2018_I69.PAR.g12886.t1.cds [Oikopleura dioica]